MRAPTAASAARSVSAVVVPVLLGTVVLALLLLVLGKDPGAFFSILLRRGFGQWEGLQEAMIRSAPLLLVAAGLLVAFRAGLWNLGADGQFLLGAALTAGVAPAVAATGAPALVLGAGLLAGVVGGAVWTLVPAVLRARYGTNEIVTTLMMSFIGINLANVLVKGPFRDPGGGVARTETIPLVDRLPLLAGPRVHVGLVTGVGAIAVVHALLARTSFGLRLHVLGSSPRAARHVGLSSRRLTVVAFATSGAAVGLAGAVEILGVQGSFRADFDPAYGLLVVPLIFLARQNPLGTMLLVLVLAAVQTGAESAARAVEVTDDVLLVLVGSILVFLAALPVLFVPRRGRRRTTGGVVGPGAGAGSADAAAGTSGLDPAAGSR